MCDVNDDASPARPARKARAQQAPKGTCVRCKAVRATLVLNQSYFCKACFLSASDTKFHKAVVRLGIRPPGPDRAHRSVLAFSGGTCSRVLLEKFSKAYLTKNGPDGDGASSGLLFGSAAVVFVDESLIVPCPQEQIDRIQAIVESYRLPFHKVAITEIFDENPSCNVIELGDDGAQIKDSGALTVEEKIKALFEGTPSLSAKEDLLKAMRTQLIQRSCSRLEATHLVLGSSTTSLANEIMECTVKGKGSAIPFLLAKTPRSALNDNLTILKPLATFTVKELALYSHFNGLDVVPVPTLTTGRPPGMKVSLQQITQTFLHTLENNRDGTCSAVYRTAARLPARAASEQLCAVCLSCPRDDKPEQAVRGDPPVNLGRLADAACWSCGVTLGELRRRDRRGAMRPIQLPLFDQISEYLIDDDKE